MRYALILASLLIASPALADGKGHKNHDPASPAQVAKADAVVAGEKAAIASMQAAGNPNPRVLDNFQSNLLPRAERWAAALHESCGC